MPIDEVCNLAKRGRCQLRRETAADGEPNQRVATHADHFKVHMVAVGIYFRVQDLALRVAGCRKAAAGFDVRALDREFEA